jgi:FKBP-type peptidyl-prolyl cis-trans isomerase FkpA
MSRFIVIALITLLAVPAFAADTTTANDDEKTLYAIGMIVARQLSVFSLTPAELETVKRGLMDGYSGKKQEFDLNSFQEKVQDLAKARRKVQGDKLAAAGKEFLETTAKEKGVQKSDSGMLYQSIKEGSGASPGPTDSVKVNYRGTLPDGKEFDSSFKRGNPLEFRLDGVIKCWTEGLQKMKPGGKAKLICPPNIAYGDTGAGELILPGATLVFEVDLLEVKKQ